jgi:hypothetical protein
LWRSAENTADTVEIVTGIGGGDCGYPFRAGRTYLVYASRHRVRDANYLSTGICSNTRELDQAGDDLAYLERLWADGQQSRIFGRVLTREAGEEWTPLAHAAVDLHRGDDTWASTTDAEGRFEFVDLPPARYHVFARDYLVETGTTSARIEAPSACAELTLFVKRPPGP